MPVQSLASLSGLSFRCSHELWFSSDPTLLWLWLWLAAVAPVGLPAWESPYAVGVALKSPQKK